ncbi:MAG: PAS domain-containing protein [Eubacteriales bacterium]|nr:PAS domain-containing protein [Eubacteriales bacterium]
MSDMKLFVPEYDEEKLKYLIKIKEQYNAGELDLETARAQLKAKVGSLKPYEIALAEQELEEIEDDECRKEDIQKMLELFEGIMDTTQPELPEDHPLSCYYRENAELEKILLEIEDLVQYPLIKNQWLELYERLAQFKIHLSRKQNQLYSILEQKGFDRPTTTMWLLDNFVRDEINQARELLDADRDEDFIARQETLVADLRDLMQKEETVLYPTSLVMIKPEEFEAMKSGDHEIGFAWIQSPAESAKPAAAAPLSEAQAAPAEDFKAELTELLAKHGYNVQGDKEYDVAMGKLSLEQINLIYKHLPVDLSYVDEHEIVKFYSDTAHRVFPRSKNVIGRDVKNCHPRSSVHIVEEIIEKFRSGEKDSAEFWINKPGLFIYIYYTAVRDESGKFRGVLEMMQDCTHIRSLVGSQTLLTWGQEQAEAAPEDSALEESEEPKAEVAAESEGSPSPIDPENLQPETMLKDLLAQYPWLKEALAELNPKFKMLQTPLARVMLPKATLRAMSERSGMELDSLIAGIQELIKKQG